MVRLLLATYLSMPEDEMKRLMFGFAVALIASTALAQNPSMTIDTRLLDPDRVTMRSTARIR